MIFIFYTAYYLYAKITTVKTSLLITTVLKL